MFTNVGIAASAGVAAALLVGASIVPTILVQGCGKNWKGEKKVESVSTGSDQENEVEKKV
jgi:outer membrane murein-binding lipoprotein Lpp